MLEPNFEARCVLFDLLDKGQIIRQFCQPCVGLDPGLFDGSRTGGNESCIERIILGPAQMYARIGPDLDWLHDQDREACRPQMLNDTTLVSTGCLNTDTSDPSLSQIGDQTSPARQRVLDLPARGKPMNRNIELMLGRIDSGRQCV